MSTTGGSEHTTACLAGKRGEPCCHHVMSTATHTPGNAKLRLAERELVRLQAENAALVAALRAVVAGYDTSIAPGEYLDDLLYHANVTARAALAAHAARTEGEGPQ